MGKECGFAPMQEGHRPTCRLLPDHDGHHRYHSFSDHPFYQVAQNAEVRRLKGLIVFQKFTCEHCGMRQTMDVPNSFFKEGQCEECGGITDIVRNGTNFVLVGKVVL